MTTYSNLKYDHAFSSNATGTGSLTLISSQTASASANISFTNIDSTYDEYVFKFINIHPATDGAKFQFNMSTDGGSNYNVTKTTTFFNANHDESGVSPSLSYSSARDLAQSTSDQVLAWEVDNDADSSCSGTLHLFNPSDTTFVKHFIATFNGVGNSTTASNQYIAGYGNTTSAINAIRFQMSSGNIDAGTILMYGVK